jgi:hypothetical protein
MHFFFSLLSIAIIAAASVSTINASPIQIRDDGVDVIARSMMGPNSNVVSWNTLPLERSPSDPELSASAAELEKRIVYNPPVTTPSKGTVWKAGSKETIRWKVDEKTIPKGAQKHKGTLMLGYLPKDGAGGENLSK